MSVPATEKTPDIFEWFGKKEDLHEDLVPYLVKNKHLGMMLKHPLIFELFYIPEWNARINRSYEHKKAAAEKAFADGDYHQYVYWHERPYRLSVFYDIMSHLDDKGYWSLLGSIWSDSENLWQFGEHHLRFLLKDQNREGREHFMDESEIKFFESLPDQFVVYRGHQYRNRHSFSWTLSYAKAQWFANRFKMKRNGVLRGIVNKKDVIGVLLGRNEAEIVVDYSDLADVSAVRRRKMLPAWLVDIKGLSWRYFALEKCRTAHGLEHWENVDRNGNALAKATSGCDLVIVRLFAYIHDAKRINEHDDPEHGHRAAVFAEELFKAGKLPIGQEQLSVLMEACRYHNDGKTSSDPTIGVCWDADRLDLPRVGIIPDAKFFSTEAAKNMLWRI